MSSHPADDLLAELRSTVVPVDAPDARDARRARTVAAISALQRSRGAGRERNGRVKRWLLAAAFVCAPAAAFAGGLAAWQRFSAIPDAGPAGGPVAALSPQPAAAATEERLPATAPTEVLADTIAPAEAVGAAAPVVRRPAVPVQHGQAAPLARHSTLADENALMQRALAAGRRGDDAGEARLLSELLRRYPESPLAPSAQTERQRAQRRATEVARDRDARGGSPLTGSVASDADVAARNGR